MANKAPGMGKMPKRGNGQPHGSTGSVPGGVNNTRGTKLHGSIKDIPKAKNPAPISHNTVGGKPARAKGW